MKEISLLKLLQVLECNENVTTTAFKQSELKESYLSSAKLKENILTAMFHRHSLIEESLKMDKLMKMTRLLCEIGFHRKRESYFTVLLSESE